MEIILKIETYEEGTSVDEITGYKITTVKQVVHLYSECQIISCRRII